MQHGSWCSCRIRSVSSALIREDHFYATWRRTCLGSSVSCWCWQFSDAAGSGFKGQPISPSAWLAQIKSASPRSPAAARYQRKLLELRSHRATARQEGNSSLLITACADQSLKEHSPLLGCYSLTTLGLEFKCCTCLLCVNHGASPCLLELIFSISWCVLRY